MEDSKEVLRALVFLVIIQDWGARMTYPSAVSGAIADTSSKRFASPLDP
jgi:hypothetical protein